MQCGPRARAAQPANGPRREKGPHVTASCKNVSELFGICYKLYGTISLVYSFTSTPLETLILSPATPLRLGARAHWRGCAGIGDLRRPQWAYPAPITEPTHT